MHSQVTNSRGSINRLLSKTGVQILDFVNIRKLCKGVCTPFQTIYTMLNCPRFVVRLIETGFIDEIDENSTFCKQSDTASRHGLKITTSYFCSYSSPAISKGPTDDRIPKFPTEMLKIYKYNLFQLVNKTLTYFFILR